MLVLSRRKNEVIVIGGNIEVKIVEIRGGTVRLAVTAPRDVSVHRKEIQEAIDKEESMRTLSREGE